MSHGKREGLWDELLVVLIQKVKVISASETQVFLPHPCLSPSP